MNEKINLEQNIAPKKSEDEIQQEFKEAALEEERIWEEIKNVFANTPNKDEAEKIILEKLAPLMDEAIKKSKETLKMMIGSSIESQKQYKEEIDELEKTL